MSSTEHAADATILVVEDEELARLIVCDRTFPTGMLGYYARQLARRGLVSLVTATSPARLGPPGGRGSGRPHVPLPGLLREDGRL